MGQIYLVRHGQASFGSADYDQLSELGLEQARLLGEWFANSRQKFHRVVTGALKRHRQTADACMAVLPKAHRVDTDWHTDPDFNEYDHHEVLVRHHPPFDDPAEIKRFLAASPDARHAFQEIFQAAMTRWMSGEHDADYRETWMQFRQRCVRGLQHLVEGADKSQSIIVFTSGGTIATICQHVLGLEDRQMAQLNWTLANCGLTKLLYQSGGAPSRRVSLSYLNNYAHLEWLGQPHTITYR
ncbi:histidine phosphatase family protein [Noviherbaspirillum sp. UKPF54]|uniref:histidine phosphatase family protein n=1 Tax=Noviherbaspirillum sp. UKPF54 TaxID=2601898 RepID=UPI0011B15139|nr:histidine phosphatase family protein [Noviherbaspirillum sp. UKPF54]QDZ26899.1 histidine phosphatase family protein [Noviherbaspirillum sp. UKPF54]